MKRELKESSLHTSLQKLEPHKANPYEKGTESRFGRLE